MKHAEASVDVDVDVEEVESGLRISVGDDGVDDADGAAGSGLAGLKDRIEALGGRISVPVTVGTRSGDEPVHREVVARGLKDSVRGAARPLVQLFRVTKVLAELIEEPRELLTPVVE